MNSNEIYLQMAELWAEMSLEHSKPSKAAHGRARSAATKIKKLNFALLSKDYLRLVLMDI